MLVIIGLRCSTGEKTRFGPILVILESLETFDFINEVSGGGLIENLLFLIMVLRRLILQKLSDYRPCVALNFISIEKVVI